MEDLLQRLVSLPTVTGNSAANQTAISHIASYLRDRGLTPEIIPSNAYQNLYVSTQNTKTPKVLLAAHVDVVPATKDMFTARSKGDRLLGRGIYDMKFAIAAYLQVVDTLRNELNVYDFGIMITADEEIGGTNGTGALVEQGYLPQVCVLPDGADDQNWNIETFAKGAWFAEFTAQGVSAHGSRPWNGDNAIDKLLLFLNEVRKPFSTQGEETSTMNVGRISGGEAINRVPDSATVGIDMRFPSSAEYDRVRKAIEGLCTKHAITAKDVINIAPTINDFNNPFLQAFAKSVKTVTGVTSQPSNTPAGTDARYFAAKGIPCIICTPPGGKHHSDEEWISREGFFQFKEVLIDFLQHTARVA